jgi:hypothetical protein
MYHITTIISTLRSPPRQLRTQRRASRAGTHSVPPSRQAQDKRAHPAQAPPPARA